MFFYRKNDRELHVCVTAVFRSFSPLMRLSFDWVTERCLFGSSVIGAVQRGKFILISDTASVAAQPVLSDTCFSQQGKGPCVVCTVLVCADSKAPPVGKMSFMRRRSGFQLYMLVVAEMKVSVKENDKNGSRPQWIRLELFSDKLHAFINSRPPLPNSRRTVMTLFFTLSAPLLYATPDTFLQ